MNVFLTVPFFRILFPFITGILVAIYYNCGPVSWIYFSLPVIGISILSFYKINTVLLKRIFLLLADIFIFTYGVTLVGQSNKSRHDLFYGRMVKSGASTYFIAVTDDLPVEKEKTIKCSLQLLEIKQGQEYQKTNGTVIAYFKKSKAAAAIKPGDVLFIKSKLQEPLPPKNPFEFNYQAYLYNRQVYHSSFVDSASFSILNAEPYLNPLWQMGLDCKAYVLKQLKYSKLNNISYAICSALLTGYDDEIDQSVIEAFSHSGTLHVLSVSGLHTGLIYLVLGFLFDLADRRRKYKLVKFLLITVILWLFALITGFSAPVLRAVVMFNLLGLGKIYFRNDYRNQLNILFVSAFILLSYNPFFITDVGFQLSYVALFGLVYFQPMLSKHWQPSNFIVNATWQSVTASFAATLSTLPLTLFYFKQFPIWFFVCNVVVVPATFIILLLAVLVVFHIPLAALLINYFVKGLVMFINLFNYKGFGFIDMIHFNLNDAFYLWALILLASLALQTRSYRQITAALLLLICWQFTGLLNSYEARQQNLFCAYQVKNTSVFALKNKRYTFLTPYRAQDYNYHIKPHLISFNYPEMMEGNFNYVSAQNGSILILDKPGSWPLIDLKDITTVVLCNNFMITDRDLSYLQKLKTLVCTGSNNKRTIKKAEELSRKFGFDFYDTSTKGAYLLALY